jgi:SAM-dependent methyltransferase
VSAAHVDDEGIHLPDAPDEPVDLVLGGHRLWSFNPARDGQKSGRGVVVSWPGPIAERLEGTAHVVVVPHASEVPVFDGEVVFGDSVEPLEIVDDQGNPLTLDKGGRLQRTFDRMDQDSLTELITASRKVLDDLVDKCGLDAYLCYGGLLGAVRTGHMIGHDSDVDLAWISPHTHPFDIVRESRAAELRMRELGWRVVRMSAANFKVWAPLPNGKRAGVDVFGSFHIGHHFHLTGSLRGELRRDQVLPFQPIELEGVEFPAPADLDAFLTYTYGPGWRVPDPAFHFDHPPVNTKIMGHWWRGTRRRLWHWAPFYESGAAARVPTEPSLFVQHVASRIEPGARVVELGSGTARDAVWLLQQGYAVTASDYSGAARKVATRVARKAGVKLPWQFYNFESTWSTMIGAAKLAHEPGPKHVYARGLIDALDPEARASLWRFCSMVGRSGGHLFLEFRTPESRGEPTHFGPHIRTYAQVSVIEAEINARGGTVVDKTVGRGLAPLQEEDPVVCRMEVSWS